MADVTTDRINILLQVNGTSSYVNAMRQVTGSTNGFRLSISALMSSLLKLVSVAAIVKFSKQCIEAASNLQEVANVVNVTFGQNADIINKWAKTQAANFGLSEKAAKNYMGTYGNMAKQFGVSLDQATKMSIELTKLTGDVASFYNITDEAAEKKLQSIFTGETETLKSLGVVMTQANLDAYAMQKGMSKTTKEMTENEKVALRYNFVLDKLSHTQGDFQRTSDGWANSVRLLKLNIENLKVEIGNQLMPVAGQMLSAVNQIISTIAPYLVSVATTIKYYGEAWKQASEYTKGFVKAAIGAFAVIVLVPKVISLVRAAVKLLTMDLATLGSVASAALGIIGILLLGAAFANLTDKVKELRADDAKTADNISDIGDSAETSSDAVNDLSDSMDNLGDSAQGLDTFLASFDEVNKVGGGNSLMSNLVNSEDLDNILGVADGLDDINSTLANVENSINSLDIGDISKDTFLDPEWWKKKWEGLKGFFGTFFNGEWKENWLIGAEEIVGALKEKFPKITAFLEHLGENIADVVEGIKKKITEWFDGLKTKIDEIKDAIENSAWFKYFAGAGEKAYDLKHEDDPEKDDTFTYTSKSGVTREVLKYNTDGTESELYKNYQASQGKTVNQTNVTNNSAPATVQFSPVIQIDGKKITAAVVDGINAMTRSSGKSPLMELGG